MAGISISPKKTHQSIHIQGFNLFHRYNLTRQDSLSSAELQ